MPGASRAGGRNRPRAGGSSNDGVPNGDDVAAGGAPYDVVRSYGEPAGLSGEPLPRAAPIAHAKPQIVAAIRLGKLCFMARF
jgi:hypothetical protein